MKPDHRREPLTQDEMNRLANGCKNGKEKLVIWTLLDTGIRVEELVTLTSREIDWQRHAFAVYGKDTVANGSGHKKRRVVNMPDRIRPLLESHFAMNDTIGMTTRTANNIVHRVANRAKISRPCSPHVLRHSFAVTSLRKGISLPALQKLLGHENLKTTAIYLNLQPEEALAEYQQKW